MKKLFALIGISIVVLLVLLGFVSPNGVSLPLYLVILVIFYVIAAATIAIICKLFTDMSITRQRFVALVCGFIPVGILALGSLSRLTFLDVFLVTAVPTLIVWYAIKRGAIK